MAAGLRQAAAGVWESPGPLLLAGAACHGPGVAEAGMAPHLPRVLQVLCSAARAALPSLPTARRPARALPAPRPTHAHASQERSAEVSAAGAAWPIHPSGQAWQKALQLAACTSNPPHANAQGALLERMDTHRAVCCTHAGHWLPTSKPPPPAYYLIPPLPPPCGPCVARLHHPPRRRPRRPLPRWTPWSKRHPSCGAQSSLRAWAQRPWRWYACWHAATAGCCRRWRM